MSTQTIGSALPATTGACTTAPSKTLADAAPGCSTSADAGWAMLPHTLAADPNLSAVDIRVALALLYFAKSKNTCTPCDKSIAARAGGINAATVQRSLRNLGRHGYIEREAVEPSDRNRTGRIIHLLWRGGADTRTRPPAHRHQTPRAPVRDKEDVIVESKNLNNETDPALRSRPDQSSQVPTITPPATQAPTPTPIGALPFDLRAIGQPVAPPVPTSPATNPQRRRPRLGLTLEELAGVAGDDPILAAELARRTAPPAPAAPPPAIIPTLELFELLPGRHDLIMAAARRLCEETNDFKVASQRTFEQMAMAVATRAVPAAVLISCWRQGMGPKSEHKGKVLVAAWKRSVAEVPLRC